MASRARLAVVVGRRKSVWRRRSEGESVEGEPLAADDDDDDEAEVEATGTATSESSSSRMRMLSGRGGACTSEKNVSP
jgi:hypothetical protein